MCVNKLLNFIKNHEYISGISFILFFLFAESIPFGKTIVDIPITFSVQFFLKIFSIPSTTPMWILLIPSAIFFVVSLLPAFYKKFNLKYFLLYLAGFSFFFVISLSPEIRMNSLFWSIPFISFLGINLWFRSWNYFYSSSFAGAIWDLGGPVIALSLGWNIIPHGVPYSKYAPALPVLIFDISLAAIIVILWWKNAIAKKIVNKFRKHAR